MSLRSGIDSCPQASGVPERGPSSLPRIPQTIDGRKNTFHTASKQKVQDSGFGVMSGRASCFVLLPRTVKVYEIDLTLDGGKKSAGVHQRGPNL